MTGFRQSRERMAYMRSLHLAVMLAGAVALPPLAQATTIYVDPDNADGVSTFVSLNAAARYLKDNALDIDGQADEVLVLVDQLGPTSDGVFYYNGTDDLLVDGDGDGNGVSCVVIADNAANQFTEGFKPSEDALFRFERGGTEAWVAGIVLRNFVLIPEFIAPGGQQTTTSGAGLRTGVSVALGAHVDTAGSVLIDNFVMAGSLEGNVPLDPFQNPHAVATRWYRGIHTGSKGNGPEQAQTQFVIRDTVLSGIATGSVVWFGDNFDATFGPGFVVTWTIDTNPINFVNSAFHNDIRFAGTKDNRNLFYQTGNLIGHRAINLESTAASEPTGTEIVEFRYSDMIGGGGRQKMRLAGPLHLIDNAIFAYAGTSGAGNIEAVNDAAWTTLNITNSTFFNNGAGGNARHINHRRTESASLSNVIFAAGRDEADTDNANTDVAFDLERFTASYSLFPEDGPFRLKGPYDFQFPPNPLYAAAYINPFATVQGSTIEENCSNLDPDFDEDAISAYPVPANLQAWRQKRITLAGSGFLRPGNPDLKTLGPGGTTLFGALSAYAVPTLSPNESVLQFADVQPGNSQDLQLTLTNTGVGLLEIYLFDVASGDASAFSLVSPPALPVQLAPDDNVVITVRFEPAEVRAHHATLEITSNDPDNPVLPILLEGGSDVPVPTVSETWSVF
jgi:hypothetical protein